MFRSSAVLLFSFAQWLKSAHTWTKWGSSERAAELFVVEFRELHAFQISVGSSPCCLCLWKSSAELFCGGAGSIADWCALADLRCHKAKLDSDSRKCFVSCFSEFGWRANFTLVMNRCSVRCSWERETVLDAPIHHKPVSNKILCQKQRNRRWVETFLALRTSSASAARSRILS